MFKSSRMRVLCAVEDSIKQCYRGRRKRKLHGDS
uniref:Uncharacterized protein n=1 Tax=Anguilla anguilla TaxID=7936 RepID=A0A0E9XS91_ANGAN